MMSSGTLRMRVQPTTPTKPPMRPPYHTKPMPPNRVLQKAVCTALQFSIM